MAIENRIRGLNILSPIFTRWQSCKLTVHETVFNNKSEHFPISTTIIKTKESTPQHKTRKITLVIIQLVTLHKIHSPPPPPSEAIVKRRINQHVDMKLLNGWNIDKETFKKLKINRPIRIHKVATKAIESSSEFTNLQVLMGWYKCLILQILHCDTISKILTQLYVIIINNNNNDLRLEISIMFIIANFNDQLVKCFYAKGSGGNLLDWRCKNNENDNTKTQAHGKSSTTTTVVKVYGNNNSDLYKNTNNNFNKHFKKL
ncbi:hypothetical protein ACTA71_000804 [Dictyostelium dimigraforme]